LKGFRNESLLYKNVLNKSLKKNKNKRGERKYMMREIN